VGTFAEYTAKMAASGKLHESLIVLERWLREWNIAVDEIKSCNMTFTLQKRNAQKVG
jgi:hypothetical protein